MKKLHCSYPNCKKVYCSRFTLRRHLEAYHYRVGRFLCSLCSKSFAYRHTLRNHIEKHPPQTPLEEATPKLTSLLQFSQDSDLRPCKFPSF